MGGIGNLSKLKRPKTIRILGSKGRKPIWVLKGKDVDLLLDGAKSLKMTPRQFLLAALEAWAARGKESKQ